MRRKFLSPGTIRCHYGILAKSRSDRSSFLASLNALFRFPVKKKFTSSLLCELVIFLSLTNFLVVYGDFFRANPRRSDEEGGTFYPGVRYDFTAFPV